MFKRGVRARDILMTLYTGMISSAMPSFEAALETTLSDEQIWGLAYYVESLAQKTESPEK